MHLRMATEFGKVLQGKLPGKRHFARLCELLSDTPAGSPVYLDFAGVKLVTGSWVNALFVPLFQWASDESIDLFPVICNAQDEWLDDLALVAEWTHCCFIVAKGALPPHHGTLIGQLDPGQRSTLEAVLELGETTGANLERKRPAAGVKATAWNNRLKDLYSKRLLRRERQGREQVYSPVIKEIKLNGR
jgi:hypothetical protein